MSQPKEFNVLKDPYADRGYGFEWLDWLGTDTIVSSSWEADPGISVLRSLKTGSITMVWLSGGSDGQTYQVRNRIVTANELRDKRTLIVKCEQR